MSELLYVDACVRGERSRTRRLAAAFLERYAGREPIYLEWADRVVDVQPTPAETARGILEVLNT